MSWLLYLETEDDPHQHVMPDFGKAHSRLDCWCQPEPDPEEPTMFVHHEEH
jgi:hypothetical protein